MEARLHPAKTEIGMAGYVNYLVYFIPRYEVNISVRSTGQLL